jgi:hypothetical protein
MVGVDVGKEREVKRVDLVMMMTRDEIRALDTVVGHL